MAQRTGVSPGENTGPVPCSSVIHPSVHTARHGRTASIWERAARRMPAAAVTFTSQALSPLRRAFCGAVRRPHSLILPNPPHDVGAITPIAQWRSRRFHEMFWPGVQSWGVQKPGSKPSHPDFGARTRSQSERCHFPRVSWWLDCADAPWQLLE